MKKLFLMLMMALPVISFTACSSSDDDEPVVETPTLAEIAAETYDVTVEVSGLEEETPEAFAEQTGTDGDEAETFELKVEAVKDSEKEVTLTLEAFKFGEIPVSNLVVKDVVLEANGTSTVSVKFENGQEISATGTLIETEMAFDGTIESGTVQVAGEAKKIDLTLKLDISKALGGEPTPEDGDGDDDNDDNQPVIITVKISGITAK